jgi:competence ComEA-like helix-hairpin-helix protein
MKTWITNYFSLTKRQYNALLALIGLTALVIVTPYIYESILLQDETLTDFETKAIQELDMISQENYKSYSRHTVEDSKVKISLFKFDPNQIEIEDWKKLGLSMKQAQSILNYRSKGGKFYKPDDLKKMYAISPAVLDRLRPYIIIENELKNDGKNFEPKSFPRKELPIIEINGADTIGLDQIKGIGAAFARRIFNYRERLGGFCRKEQLREVYGIDSLKFEEIKAQIQIDPSMIKKININTADFEILKIHPYLKYKQINAIIQYRKQHGNYTSIADLKKILILNPQTIEQIAPYLQF